MGGNKKARRVSFVEDRGMKTYKKLKITWQKTKFQHTMKPDLKVRGHVPLHEIEL